MQPQSPDLSSEPSADAAATEQPSEQVEQTSGVTGFLQRLWRGRDGRFATGSEDNQVEEANQPAVDKASSQITLTQEELDRRIQAETDRREHKRAQEAQAERKRKLR